MFDDPRLERLNACLERAARSPFQRARGRATRLGSVQELAGLPAVSAAELLADQAAHPPLGTNLAVDEADCVQLHRTSGTTGRPLAVPDSAGDVAWWSRRFAALLRAGGVERTDRVALAWSFGPYVQFWASLGGVRELGALALPLGGMDSTQRLRTMRDHGATALVTTPSYAAHLARVAVAEGLEEALEPVRLVVCGGEPGASLPAVRAALEAAWGARVVDHLGSTEAGSFAVPCAEHGGVHLAEEDFVCELLRPGGEEPAAEGEEAELVVTALEREAFPAVRHRTGDVVLRRDAPCPAGHPGRWLPEGILGRADDMVVVRGMNVFPSAVEQLLREHEPHGEFRITFYTDPRAMDEVKLEAELARPSDARALQERMRQSLGLRVRIVPVRPGALGPPAGKRRVVDLRR